MSAPESNSKNNDVLARLKKLNRSAGCLSEIDKLNFLPPPDGAGQNEFLLKAEDAFNRGFKDTLDEFRKPNSQSQPAPLPKSYQGVYEEGRAMASYLLDKISPGSRWQKLADSSAARHVMLLHVGLGMAAARLDLEPKSFLSNLHPLNRWLAMDGYGFHCGYFEPARYLKDKRAGYSPGGGHEASVFDQGLGRSIWFLARAKVDTVPEVVNLMPPERQWDLWYGIGLAAAYAGGANAAALRKLLSLADRYGNSLKAGVSFAAYLRESTQTMAGYTEEACQSISGRPGAELCQLVAGNRPESADQDPASFQIWQKRIVSCLQQDEP